MLKLFVLEFKIQPSEFRRMSWGLFWSLIAPKDKSGRVIANEATHKQIVERTRKWREEQIALGKGPQPQGPNTVGTTPDGI